MQARACAVSAVASCTHRCPGGDAQPATTMAFESVPGGCKPCLHSGESIVIMASRVPASLVPALAPALALALALALAPTLASTLALALASSPSVSLDRLVVAVSHSQTGNTSPKCQGDISVNTATAR